MSWSSRRNLARWSECALRQQKDHKAHHTGASRLPSQDAPCCLGGLRPGHRRDSAAFPAVIDTIPLPHPRRNLTLAKYTPSRPPSRWRFFTRFGAVCGGEVKYSRTCKRTRARHDGRLPWPTYCSTPPLTNTSKSSHTKSPRAREVGASADVKRVPELLSPEAAKAANYKLDQTTSPSTTRSS